MASTQWHNMSQASIKWLQKTHTVQKLTPVEKGRDRKGRAYTIKECKLYRCPYLILLIHGEMDGQNADSSPKFSQVVGKASQRLGVNIVSGKDNGEHDHSDYEEEYKFIRKHVYAALDGRDESSLPSNSVRNENLPCLTADNLRNLMIKEKTLKGEWADEEHRHLVLRALQCFKQRDINRAKGKNEIRRTPPTFQ